MGALCTDVVALGAAWHECSQILTLLLFWTIFLTIFSAYRMPLCFLVLSCINFLSGFELRFAIVRMQELRPPISVLSAPFLLTWWGLQKLGRACVGRLPRRGADRRGPAMPPPPPPPRDVELGPGITSVWL